MRQLSWIARLALVVAAGALLTTAVAVGVAPRLWHAANAHDEEPVDLPTFAPLAQRSYVYDAAGNEIAVFERENSQPIKLDQVPKRVIEAFLAVEDAEFYRHDGVNVRSFIRATLSNFASDSPQQGASTITMQVVKNDFLAGLERDGRYKLLQVHYALMLERSYTKDAILQRYLNTVFFGNNAYGIQAGAETYFAKTVRELTFTEAAFMAGLVRSPSGYDPINEPERSRSRFVQVLDRLVDEGHYTEREAKRIARNFVLPERVKTIPQRVNVRTYFTEALRDYLLNRSDLLGDTAEQRGTALYRGGLRIHTTLDPVLQLHAENARNVLPDTPQGFDASIVSLDTQSGAIRAMVGGRGFGNPSEVNMALSPRQTGSSIKLFILAAALQAGAQPSDIIDGTTPCTLPDPNDPAKPFIITRATARAPSSLAEMTWSSINCAYARLSQVVGLHRVVDSTYRMAESNYLNRELPESERDPILPLASYATGANEMSPLDMAAGAQTIANEGLHQEPYYVEYIETAVGRRVYTHADAGTQVLDRGVALTAVDVLKGVLRVGTGRRYPLADGRPAAGKTGTQDFNTNSWFVGFTPYLTTSVWIGDPNGYTPMVSIPEFAPLGSDTVQGGRLPTLIWKTYMDPAHAGRPFEDWDAPPPDARPPARLYLPGEECLVQIVGYTEPQIITVPTTPGAEPPPPEPEPEQQGLMTPEQQPPPTEPPRRTDPPPATTTPESTTPETIVIPPEPIYEPVPGGTTIPPDVLDPRVPLPSTPLTNRVIKC